MSIQTPTHAIATSPISRNWSELASAIKPKALSALRESAAKDVETTLRELRRNKHTSQVELAQKLQTSQAHISAIESGSDVRLSTLQRYVEVLGGSLEIRVKIGSDSQVLFRRKASGRKIAKARRKPVGKP